jgi:putative acetyltransferase
MVGLWGLAVSLITIRQYQPDDVAALVDLFRRAVREIAGRDYSEVQVRAWAPDAIDHAAFARRRENKHTWIAQCDGRIAGFSDLEADGHIDMLYVHPDFQRRGIARALLAHIEAAARASGTTRLYTEASVTARPVFEKLGFKILAAQTVTVGGDLSPDTGELFTNYRMEKAFLLV